MKLVVKLFGTLRRFSNQETPGLWQGEVPSGTTLLGLIALLGTTEQEVAAAAINGKVMPLETEISEDAVVTLVTPMGGGSDDRKEQ